MREPVATTKDAYKLFHDGIKAFARMEEVGMRVDVGYLDRRLWEVDDQIKANEEKMRRSKFYKLWVSKYGLKTNLGSRPQLGAILVDVLGKDALGKTPSGRVSTTATALETVDHPFIRLYLKTEKLKKLLSTYLKGFLREVDDGLLHPVFNLHLVRTQRSSSDNPNFQNIPARDPMIAEIIRRCIIAREGQLLVEIDYSALEFRIAACFWRDPAMVSYASDPTLDIHRDMASEIFLCRRDQVNKRTRYCAKNQFVFPELYGSNYISSTKYLWDSMERMSLEVEGQTAFDWLKAKGIHEMGRCSYRDDPEHGTFERHMLEVEESFAGKFPQWASSREDWWNKYQRVGSFRMMTGFECNGVYSKNEVYNYPIQGPAFHCLLKSLIMLDQWLREEGMVSRIIGQIHDSIVLDVHPDEFEEVVSQAKYIMTVEVPRLWDWIIVPLEVEVEASPVGGTWFDKKPIEVSL